MNNTVIKAERKKMHLMMVIHNHQPVGNFEHIFIDGWEGCYKPFLDILLEFPSIKVALHYSGPLLEFFYLHYPEVFERFKIFIKRGQVEFLGGGFYEPMLSVLRDEDALGQIDMMRDFFKTNLQYEPQGMWLAERVWDPDIPRILNRAGIKYTLLDDRAFLLSGIEFHSLKGYYVTEKAGRSIAIFPIDKNLRYLIPFKEPAEIMNYLRTIYDSSPESVSLTYGDDGEKFGIWPGTREWVFQNGWLRRFFERCEMEKEWLEFSHPSEIMKKFPPTGRIYLPIASYEEMMEWAQLTPQGKRRKEITESLKSSLPYDEFKNFLYGGIWQNFLVKYPESNLMHKKMLFLSNRLSKIEKENINDNRIFLAKKELYKGQCNCPYWHGLFGGLYLNYLRHAIYEHLLGCEYLLDEVENNDQDFVEIEKVDIDLDYKDEILLRNKPLTALIKPFSGGALLELSFKKKRFNILNNLTRREEIYHGEIYKINAEAQKSETPKTIHELKVLKEEGLEKLLIYDKYPRFSFLTHILPISTSIYDFSNQNFNEIWDGIFAEFEIDKIERKNEGVAVALRREAIINIDGVKNPTLVEKEYKLNKENSQLDFNVKLENKGEGFLKFLFGVEINFTLLGGKDPRRIYRIGGYSLDDPNLDSFGIINNVDHIIMEDHWNLMRVKITTTSLMNIWRMPVMTVSQSEGGIEKSYQGSCILFIKEFSFSSKDKIDLNFSVIFEDIGGGRL